MRKLLNFSALSLTAVFLLSAGFAGAQHHDAHTNDTLGNKETHTEAFEEHGEIEEGFNATEVVMHHISDSHGFHVLGEGDEAVSVPLPVILWTDKGLVTFMSSEFHHDTKGEHPVERKGMTFLNYHEKIYIANEDGRLEFDGEHHPVNETPLDLSITKNVFTLLFSALLLCLIFMSVAASYKKGNGVPKGLTSFMEPLIVFVRDDIARPNIGEKKYQKYMPFLLTLFFLIWLNNLMGLIPFFPFSANLSGNIAFTMTLAFFTLLVVNFSGNKSYWKHTFSPPVPWALYPIMIPIELLGIFTKPFALMIRLFANITAGHIIVLSLISLIFIFKNVFMAGVAVPFALFISVLELLVAALQAYIFTMLSALFIGQAVSEEPH